MTEMEFPMRRFFITLLLLTLVPTATLWSQGQAVPTSDSAVPTDLADADVVTAAELETTLAELETVHAQNYNAVATIIDKVPAEVRPVLEQALESSKRGYLQAKSNRERTTAMRQAKANARLARLQGQGGKPPQAGTMKGQMNGQGNRGFAGLPQGQGQTQGLPQFQGQPQVAGQLPGQSASRTAQADFGRPLNSMQIAGQQSSVGQPEGGQNVSAQSVSAQNVSAQSKQPNGGQGRGQLRR